MKRQVWIPLALSVVAAYLILDHRAARYAAEYDDLEAAAIRTADWGSKQRITGKGRSLLGRLKEGLGRLTGDQDLAERGVVDQIAGAAQETSGRAAHIVSDAIHDLNRY
ncbi:MAG TPA: CsbD family protein [Acidobacteriaceae bacterium]|nr:CsbD family protein [Terriglobia bacterium]HVC90779.1 CsbD family protein [Acidobacteriaceae bacterium]